MNSALLRKHASAVVLALIAAALTVVVFVDSGSITTAETEARKNRLLPAFRLDDITKVEVDLAPEGEPARRYTLSRPPKGAPGRTWSLGVGDSTFEAEEQTADSLLFALDRARVLRRIAPEKVDRAAFGLDRPRTRIAVTMGELAFEIAVGALAPSQEGHYAEVAGEGVVILSKGDVKRMEVGPDELRSDRLQPYLSFDLDALHIEGAGGTRRFEAAPWKGGRGSRFRFGEGSEGPKGERVDGDRFDQVLVALANMKARRFLDKAEAEAHTKPLVTISLLPREREPGATFDPTPREPGVLDVGGVCPGDPDLVVVVRRSPGYVAACVPKGVLTALTRPATDFIDDGLVGAALDEIQELRIERGDQVLELAPTGDGYKVMKPREAYIDKETGANVLEGLIDIRGERAPGAAALPNGPVTKVLVVSRGVLADDPKRVEEIEIGPEVEGKHLVIRKEDGAKLFIGTSAAKVLRPSDLLLKARQVIERRPIDVLEMTVVRGGETHAFRQSGPDLTLVSPKGSGLSVDRSIANRAMGAFVTLTAVRWVAEKPAPEFGLDEPRALVKVKLDASGDEKEKTVELALGAYADDGVYAKITGETAVFVVPRSVEEAFDESFVSLDALSFDPSDAERIEVEVGGETVVLERDGRQLRWKGRSDAKAAALLKEIFDITAVYAVGAGPPADAHGLGDPAVRIRVTPRKAPDEAAAPQPITLSIGAAGTVQGVPIRYARRDDIEATYAVGEKVVRRIRSIVRE